MANVKIVHASISENGTINGQPGDQTRGEVCRRDMYQRGWKWILRPDSMLLAADIALQAGYAADNDNIGYGQADRLSLNDYIEENDVAFMDEVDAPVNCDCSSLVAAILRLEGLPVPEDMWTGNERDSLMKTGVFDSLPYTDKTPLLVGDILLATGHTAIVVEVKSEKPSVEVADRFNPEFSGIYYPDTLINVRSGPGTDRPVMGQLVRSAPLRNYGYCSIDGRGVVWLLVRLPAGTTGWVSSNVVRKESVNEE